MIVSYRDKDAERLSRGTVSYTHLGLNIEGVEGVRIIAVRDNRQDA